MARRGGQSWFRTRWWQGRPAIGWPSSWKGWVAYFIALLALSSAGVGEWMLKIPSVGIAATLTVMFMAFGVLFATKTGGDDRPSERATAFEEYQDEIERERWRRPFDLEG